MEYRHLSYPGADIRLSLFAFGRREGHAYIRPADHDSLAAIQMKDLADAARRLAEETGMHPVFMRWLLSDPANQSQLLPNEKVCATSVIGQPPLDGAKATLLLIMEEDSAQIHIGDGIWTDTRGKLWAGDNDVVPPCDSRTMTAAYLSHLDAALSRFGASLCDNCLRTWLFVRDIDNNYAGVVRGRNIVFQRLGLTPSTHFIASTGIEGANADPHRLVSFNAIADTRVSPEQITYLYGPTHLNPTYEYGVAFERGTAVDYPDRRHVYISGTASIDRHGQIVAPSDVRAQSERMLENIEVLLKEGGCAWSDVAHITVYLRDIADHHTVRNIVETRLPDIPKAIVLASVCRPGWLVEAECTAIRKS